MADTAARWVMTAPREPLQQTTFDPLPGAGEVVVEIAGCGVCHTDLGFYYDGVRTKHPLPLALGHGITAGTITARPRHPSAPGPVATTWPLISWPRARGSGCLVRTPS